jgi:hypothetical protein
MLAAQSGSSPPASVAKATAAYGTDVARKAWRVLQVLSSVTEVHQAAATLDMDARVAARAVASFRRASSRAWPELDFAVVSDEDEPT